MKYGFGLPITVLDDPGVLLGMTQALDDAGFDFVSTGGHVLSAESGLYSDRPTPLYAGPFHDPFVLFSYLAAGTERIHFRTSILILPALPTGLVALQSAALDLVSGGRFELGVGISWNPAEYGALGQDVHNRGVRIEEQVELLRRLWSESTLTFKGKYHDFEKLGLNWPRPVNVPILFGTGIEDRVLRRAARLGDGWIAGGMPMPQLIDTMARLRALVSELREEGTPFSLTARVVADPLSPETAVRTGMELLGAGATDISIAAAPGLAGAAALESVIEAREQLVSELG
jgi:probable F420-dependent oxidoreductase